MCPRPGTSTSSIGGLRHDPIVPYGNRPVNFQILAAAHLQSKAGNTFCLVIDYDKPIDEETEMYETYFLNLVDERDLLALMSDEEKEEVPTPTPEIIYVTPEPTAVPAPTPVVTEPEPEKKLDQMTAIIALATIVLLGGGGAIFMLKNNNIGKRQM